jgi:hypothetical protein
MRTSTIRIALICSACLTLRAALALDLTPLSAFKELEGMKIPVVQFTEARGKVNYQPPGNWRPIGRGKSIMLVPPDGDQSLVKFIAIDKKPPAAPDANAVPDDLKTWAMQFIPQGSKDIAFVQEIPSPYSLEGQPSREFIFTYVLNGSMETISVSVSDLNDTERLVVIVATRTKDFETIRHQTISSLFSWRPVN